jgi:hypothetical protein
MTALLMDTQITTLSRLSEALLLTLGYYSDQANLLEVLRQSGLDNSGLLRQGPIQPYPVAWTEHGLIALMQHIKPNAGQKNHAWGLQSITLQADRWPGPWPKDLNPETVTPDEIVGLLAQNKAQAVCMPQVVCCLTPAGTQGRTWAAVALFDAASGKLKHLTLARQGEWAAAASPAAAITATNAAALPPITCSTGGAVTQTGWYEGRLPPWHPSHASFSKLDTRFVYRQAGERMTRLGVGTDTDEMLVVWTWRGEQKPQ